MTPPARRSAATRPPSRVREKTVAQSVLADDHTTLLDVVDNVLTKGVVLTGELTIGLAHVDLVYARLSLLLCAADRIMPGEDRNAVQRLQDRSAARKLRPRGTRAGRR